MKLSYIIKNYNGLSIIKQYIKSRTLFTALGEILLLGKSRTALEILRLSIQLKIKKKLKKRYSKKIEEFDISLKAETEKKSSDKVWICWFQGMENAPELVQKCYQSVLRNLPDKDVIVITSENMKEYVSFPEHIIRKWEAGIISHTHMTDLLRLELLIKYGGLWLDSTVLCSGKDIPEYFFDSDLFFFQNLKPGRNGHSSYISSWLISAKSNNKILMATRYLCYEYWKENNEMLDYFLLHFFMSIVLEYYKDDWDNVVPRDNSTPHILLLRLFDEYDEKTWKFIKEQTPFHKLSYKFDKNKIEINNTYYSKLIKNS